MRKKKTRYSLTAKERRQQHKAAQSELTEQQKEEHNQKLQKKKAARGILVRMVSLALASVLATTALIAAVILIVTGTEVDNLVDNPVAVITLADGSKINMELMYKENIVRDDEDGITNDGRAAVANFIYLAENKFFDGTIFTNSVGGLFAMEGFTSPGVHRGQDEQYISRLKGFAGGRSNKWGEAEFKLGYRLNQKTIVTAPTQKEGYVAMLSGSSTWGSSTGFVMISDNSANLTVAGEKLDRYMTYIARMDTESVSVLKGISAAATTANDKVKGWQYPTDYDSVRIKTVRVSNLNKNLRKNIMNRFEEFVLDKDTTMADAMHGLNIWRVKCNQYIS